jgi:hypothetical protein
MRAETASRPAAWKTQAQRREQAVTAMTGLLDEGAS